MILCPGGRLLGIRQIVLVVEMGTLAAGALREGERKVAIRQQLFSTRLAASTRTHLTTSPFLTYAQTPCGLGSYGGRTGGTGSTYADVIRTCITHGPCLSRARADVYEGDYACLNMGERGRGDVRSFFLLCPKSDQCRIQ